MFECDLYHYSACLRSWLEQDTSCPTCRMSLTERPEEPQNNNVPDERGDAANNMPEPNQRALSNHFFHFDGKLSSGK